MNSNKKMLALGILIGALAVFVLGGAGTLLTGNGSLTDSENSTVEEDSLRVKNSESSLVNEQVKTKMEYLSGLIEEYYIEETDPDTLVEGMYKGLTEALDDPYSVYYDEEETKALTETIDGTYSGIGAMLSKNADTKALTVIRCFEDTPALEAGLVPGDVILSVDGEDISTMEVSAAVALIKGEEGTTVNLEIYRDGEPDTMILPVTRRKIDIPTVAGDIIEDGIGYIQISSFDKVTTKQFDEVYTQLQNQGMEGLIIDLRSNPGGMLNVVCEISEYFVPQGLIVYTEDKNGQRVEYTAEGKGTFGKPLVVLVNGNSASASEIFAGAVQDTNTGKIVGTQTYGKGVVQQVISLGDGTAVKLTISKYYTPNGNDIDKKGITPDIVVELDEKLYQQAVVTIDEDNQVQKALETVKNQLQ